MEIRPIHNEDEYKEALQIASVLVDADPAVDTPDGNRLKILAALLERYEAEHLSLDVPDPVEAMRFRLEQTGLSASGTHPSIGSLNRVVTGRSHAVQLPRKFRFEEQEVYVRRDPETGDVILSRRPGSWETFFALDKLKQVPDNFMSAADRGQDETTRDPYGDGAF